MIAMLPITASTTVSMKKTTRRMSEPTMKVFQAAESIARTIALCVIFTETSTKIIRTHFTITTAITGPIGGGGGRIK